MQKLKWQEREIDQKFLKNRLFIFEWNDVNKHRWIFSFWFLIGYKNCIFGTLSSQTWFKWNSFMHFIYHESYLEKKVLYHESPINLNSLSIFVGIISLWRLINHKQANVCVREELSFLRTYAYSFDEENLINYPPDIQSCKMFEYQ